jgi:ACS family hexuronate transporter-like MFS transporter
VTAATISQSSGLPRFRWVVCGLLFFATTINYVDRQVLSILAAPLQRELQWTESEYGYIVTAFQAAYAAGMLVCGRLLDRVGTRIGYALGVSLWSVAAIATGFASSAFGFGAARFALGFGESSNFPAAIKTTAEWFPARERAFATGVLNSGTNIGAVLAPLLVPVIALRWGWRWAFYLTGAVGFVWLVVWLLVYRRPSRAREAALFEAGSSAEGEERPVSWSTLLRMKETWALGFGRFCADPIWWFYLYWTPKFLDARHGVTLVQLAAPLITIYLVADAGSIVGGYVSSARIRRGVPPFTSLKGWMLGAALCVTPIVLATVLSNLWATVAIVALAAAAHQAWSANIFTLVSDLYPQRAVASMVGVSGFFGAIGGMIFAAVTGQVLQRTGLYWPMFVVAGVAYLVALSAVHWATRERVELAVAA